MKKTMATLVLALISFPALASQVTSSGTCELQSYDGKGQNNFVFKLGKTISYMVTIDNDGYEDMTLVSEDGSEVVLGYTEKHAFNSAIGATYITGFNNIYKPPAGGFDVTKRIELGEGKNTGTLKAQRDSTCSGGYIGGCSGGATAIFTCK